MKRRTWQKETGVCERHSCSSLERLVAVAMLLVAGGSYYASSLRPSDLFLSFVHKHKCRAAEPGKMRKWVHLKGTACEFDWVCVPYVSVCW